MINIKENEKLNMLNHSCAHLLAHAIKHLYPKALFWVGPAIEEGFYYDIDLDESITIDDLSKIEKEMKKISKSDKRITRLELSKKEALDMFKENPYKLDIINNLSDDEVITAYKQDDFIDLCRGPHMPTTKSMKYFRNCSITMRKESWYSSMRIMGYCFSIISLNLA